MSDLIALITIIIWPVVPLFWIPVHGLSRIFKRLGILTYVMPLITWLPLAYLIYSQRGFLLKFKVDFPMALNTIGIIFLIAGTLLHIWTGKLLGLWGLVGLPEISTKIRGGLITVGPFAVVRHPTYLAHTVMFFGIFLITETAAVGIITLLDFVLVNAVIIPLEDRELLKRFGEDYKKYKEKVPPFFPSPVLNKILKG
ncbi:MAG: isoprenylcysteine carboxylmethyltransferase family protein [Thermodesulfovibrionia bacterium]|nr:isoprenylcysteine carboxylmethyltransferase family protein [Thermodesulfovibrionia bacterium]